MVGRPGRIKSKGSEASTSQEGDTPKVNRSVKRQGRPRKSGVEESPPGSRESTPYSPANVSSTRKRTLPSERVMNLISEFDSEEDIRCHRLARFIAEHPDSREEWARILEERPSFPPWIEEKDLIEYDGTVFRTGDIVCLFDEDEEDKEEEEERDLPYYAQIRSMIHDQFMRPYAWITWLVPRNSAEYAHEFQAEHFVHSLIDHKMYDLECLRWECERPELPAYQVFNEHRAVIDKHRQEQFRQRRVELFKAANFELAKGIDVVRAGDVKLAHSKEHEDDLKKVLEKAQERAIAKKEEREKMQARIRGEKDKDKEEKEKEEGFKLFSSLLLNRSLRSASLEDVSDEGEAVEEEGERELKRKVVRGRGRIGSQTSTTSKGTVESAESSAKPMEEG